MTGNRKIFDMGRLDMGYSHQAFGLPDSFHERIIPPIPETGVKLGDREHRLENGKLVVFKNMVVKPTKKRGVVEISCQISQEHLRHFEPNMVTIPLVGVVLPTKEEEDGSKEA
jgi:hypothetical protein